MKRLILLCALYPMVQLHYSQAGRTNVTGSSLAGKSTVVADSLPAVLTKGHGDLLENRLRHEAVVKYGMHQLPTTAKEWAPYRAQLKRRIMEKTGVEVHHNLPLDMKETGSIQLPGYRIKNIAFQTRPGIYATANLYIPEGEGPFPAVVNMLGHWRKGKADPEGPQGVGHSLARNGYVCLSIDPWGAGERTTVHGDFEYHGANLGGSLLNLGQPLVGLQVSDNMRGVDLLSSLPYVDRTRIGATGASGGGNQTMWLTALDERVKAAVPVVSVGTFESYVMRSNCICELLNDGLTFTEEAGVLALVAPRAILMCNHKQDSAPAFFPAQMQRSVQNARPVFRMLGVENNISYQIFDKTHGYWPEDREAMLGWFDLHLKGTGTGAPKKEGSFELLPPEKLMTYPVGQRDPAVVSTDAYCRKRGGELRTAYLKASALNPEQKKKELRSLLRLQERSGLKKVHRFTPAGGWGRLALETSDGKLIPLLHRPPANVSLGYVILVHPGGKNSLAPGVLDELRQKGAGIVLADLSGTGEVASLLERPGDKAMAQHTLARAELWLGKTLLGEWVKELNVISQFLRSEYQASRVGIDGSREAGLAALFLSAAAGKADHLVLRDAPLSYLFDNRQDVDFFSMAIHLPGFLQWGDVSLAAALSGSQISFVNPVTMSGRRITGTRLKEYQAEFDQARKRTRQPGQVRFSADSPTVMK